MSIQEYYTKELQALRILGTEFSNRNPGLSTFLARKGQDPDVERLLEGFSFLTGRLRQYIDEELPEVSNSLAQLLWPNFLRPIPSYSILEFNPLSIETKIVVPKGEEVMAVHPKTEEPCTFTTCFETVLYPVSISDVSYYIRGNGGVLELKLSLNQGARLDQIDFDHLRFYIGSYEQLSYDLYLHLLNYVEKALIVFDVNEFELDLGPKCFKAVGFGSDENILPMPGRLFPGHQLLQEFFCFREKFMFLDLDLNALKEVPSERLDGVKEITIKIFIREKMKISKKIGKDNFRLNCTPIVNIFETEAEPIRKCLYEEYEVRVAGLDYESSEVYSVEKVEGWDSRVSKYHRYFPFESFEHDNENSEFYYTRVKLSDDRERTKTYIRFGEVGGGASRLHYDEDVTVSLKILATNRDLPSSLELGSITSHTARSSISKLKFSNITVPSRSYTPPLKDDFFWRIISNMSLNYLSIDNADILKRVMEGYDFIGVTDSLHEKQTKTMLEGIVGVENMVEDMIHKGLPIRGAVTIVKLKAQNFTSIGEAFLMLSVMSHFFALFCNINSFHRMEAIIDKKAHFSWPPRIGLQPLI